MESFSNDIHAILRELNQAEDQADELNSVDPIFTSNLLQHKE